MRYGLRTLLILLAVIAPLLAWLGWPIASRLLCPSLWRGENGRMDAIEIDSFSFPIDKELSEITAQISLNDGQVKWNIDVDAVASDTLPDDYPYSRVPHIGIQISPQGKADLNALRGQAFEIGTFSADLKELPDSGHCYVGIHLINYNHELRFVAADSSHATISWKFDATETPSLDPLTVRVSCTLRFKEATIWFENEEPDIESATSLVARNFPLSTFGKPTVDRWMVRFPVIVDGR